MSHADSFVLSTSFESPRRRARGPYMPAGWSLPQRKLGPAIRGCLKHSILTFIRYRSSDLLPTLLFTTALLCSPVYAAAPPVVDDSDKFAVFDEEPTAGTRAHTVVSQASDEDEPLAKVIPADRVQDSSLAGQLRAMQQDLQSLRGELEVQAHALKQLEQQQLTFYKDIDARLRAAGDKLPAAHPTPIDATPPAVAVVLPSSTAMNPPAHVANPADEQVTYLAAYDLVKTKRYADALMAMQAFVKQYPTGGYTANAEYWIGELYLTKNMPMDAMKHFETVLKHFPTSSKAAASALKIGYALNALGRQEEAKQRLREVIKSYPDTAAAQLAKTKLEAM